MTERSQPTLVWPWHVWRHYRTVFRDLAIKHARERAALTDWEIECHYYLSRGELQR